MIISILQTVQVRAQSYFEPATLNETTAGATTVNSRCIGNDIMNVSGNIFRVSVWDDLNSGTGIAWECDYQSTFYSGLASLQYTSDITDPDIALTYASNVAHAIVGYYDVGAAEYNLDVFTWRNTSPNVWEFYLTNSYQFHSGTSSTTTMNIDADDSGGFVIALRNGTKILVFTGSVSGGVATFNNSGTEVFIDSGSYPDLCVFNDGNDHVVHLVYVDASGDLIISTHNHADLASGSGTPVGTPVTVNPTSGYSFHFPRIACPTPAIGTVDDWTVITEETDGTYDHIVGFNDNSPTSRILYNNGSGNSPYDITDVPNYLPVVTYDDQSNTWAGWIFDNSSGNHNAYAIDDAIFPVVLKCDFDAQIISAKYWEVPTFLYDGDEVVILALSGRFGINEIYVTYHSFIATNGTSEEIYNKIVDPTAGTPGFRTITQEGNEETLDSRTHVFIPFEEDQEIELSVYDISGRKIWSGNELLIDKSQLITRHFSGKYQPGIYLLKIADNKQSVLVKFSVIR